MSVPRLGIYIHWPYCARICPYCDFNVVRDRGGEKTALAGAILADLAAHAALTGPRQLASIFFGGGTPSLMDPDAVAQIVETARALWTPAADLEITLEANPTDAEADRFAALARAGVNRLSLGVQSLDDAALAFLGRNHDAATGRRAAIRAARAFPRLSLDLIYARPGQSPAGWALELRQAIDLGAEHISPYQLTIEPETAFHRAVARGALIPPPPDLAADLFETTQAVLGDAGFEAYEVSNHAQGAAARSRHNLLYWRGDDYVGVGPGAHGRLTVGVERWASVAPNGVADYIDQVRACGLGAARERLDARAVALERLLMGLRTVEGVAWGDLAALRIPEARIAALADLARLQHGRLTVTLRGRPVLDRIVADLADGA
ncbi:MAG: radical SAM family heme chaperone HemW [Pseudomonadota bacterium]|nr:radical SAM family heme chaperone HemW [Pseudomonadota bacterium]